MIAFLGRYHRHLVSKAASASVMERFIGVQFVALPWVYPFFGLIAWGWIFNPSDHLRELVVLLVAVPAMVGATYAMTTYMVAGFVADWSRRRIDR